MNKYEFLNISMIILYYIFIIGSTGYVVFYLGYSGWWFALAALFCTVVRYEKEIYK